MADVKTLDQQVLPGVAKSVSVQAPPTRRATAEDFGAGRARNIGAFGKAVGYAAGVGVEILESIDQTEALDAFNQARDQMSEAFTRAM